MEILDSPLEQQNNELTYNEFSGANPFLLWATGIKHNYFSLQPRFFNNRAILFIR